MVRTGVVDLARAGVDSLEQLIDFFIRHLLAEVGQDVLELADADEARHILVEDLEAAAVLLGLAGIAEATGAVQDALEALEVDYVEKSVNFKRSYLACCGCSWSRPSQCTRDAKLGCSISLSPALTFASDALLKVLDLGNGRVLAAGAEKITQGVGGAAAVAALVEQGESLLVVGGRLRIKLVRSHDA